MIEVPSAAILAGESASRVQFFSIGANDLTQYLLAADRTNAALARLQDVLHPAVPRTIAAVVAAADATDARSVRRLAEQFMARTVGQ
jgi:phosphoenolpyruvate-protein kinase (PTS system EI component)